MELFLCVHACTRTYCFGPATLFEGTSCASIVNDNRLTRPTNVSEIGLSDICDCEPKLSGPGSNLKELRKVYWDYRLTRFN